MVVDKPAGLLSVPGRGPDKQDCLARRVQALWPEASEVYMTALIDTRDMADRAQRERHEIVSTPSECALGHERREQFHDEDGLWNYCALCVIGIRHLYHKI